jgi:hypothetical protein
MSTYDVLINFENDVEKIDNEWFKEILKSTYNGIILEDFMMPNQSSLNYYSDMKLILLNDEFKRIYNHYCSWCIVTNGWISILADMLKGKKCIEIMAGSGLLSYALKKYDVNITAYDNYSWNHPKYFTDVISMNADEASSELSYDYIICSWPPYEEKDILNVLKNMYYKHPKSKLIYIGEWYGGCCACDEFFEMTNHIHFGKDTKYIKQANIKFRSFYDIYDRIHLLEPNSNVEKYFK